SEGAPTLIRSLALASAGGGVGRGAGVVGRAGGGASWRRTDAGGRKIRSLTGSSLSETALAFFPSTRVIKAIMIIKWTIADMRKPWRWSKRPMPLPHNPTRNHSTNRARTGPPQDVAGLVRRLAIPGIQP